MVIKYLNLLNNVFLMFFYYFMASKDKEKLENPSLVFSGDREIPTRGSTVPVSTGTVDPRVGISRFHCTPMIDSISHISNKE